MSAVSLVPVVLGLLLCAVGAGLLGSGRAAARQAALDRTRLVSVVGVVSRSPLRGAYGSDITYPLPDGTPRTFRTRNWLGDRFRDGQQVELLVDPRAPLHPRVQGEVARTAPGLLTALGALLLVPGVVTTASGLLALLRG